MPEPSCLEYHTNEFETVNAALDGWSDLLTTSVGPLPEYTVVEGPLPNGCSGGFRLSLAGVGIV